MVTLNKVILMGHLGQDPVFDEFRQTGDKKATLRIATTERGYTSKSGTAVPDRTEWHTVVFWGRMAELVMRTLHKGSCVYIEGKLTTRKREKEGQDAKWFAEILGNRLIFLDKRDGGTSVQENASFAQNGLKSGKYEQSLGEVDNDMPF